MNNPITYWDSILICDNCLPEGIYQKALKVLSQKHEMKEGEVGGADPDDTRYLFTTDSDLGFVAETLLDSGFIPQLNNHDVQIQVRHHIMEKGGKMAWHCDSGYSIAATAYFSHCDGGELQVESPCRTQSVLIKPQPNRVVVIKCDNMHRVAEVFDGKRESVQIFYTFIERSENGYLDSD